MILERMTEEEIERLTRLVEGHIPKIEMKTGLPRKLIREVLIVSAILLTKEKDKNPMPLDQYIARHCHRVASDLAVNLYDVRNVVEAWVIALEEGVRPDGRH